MSGGMIEQQPPPPDPKKRKQPIFHPKAAEAAEAAPVLALIITMLLIHCWIAFSGQGSGHVFFQRMAFVPQRFWVDFELERLLSYAFLHVNWVHVLMNSLLIYLLGSRNWRFMGTARFLVFFVVTAVAGAVAFAVVRPDDVSQLAGASGAAYGLFAAFLRYRFRVQTLRGKDMRMTALISVGMVILVEIGLGLLSFDVLSGTQGRPAAWEAHIGGFLVGWLITPWLVKFWPQ